MFVISTALPFTQARWCGAAGVDHVAAVSDHQTTEFGERYGCLIKERRILRRAVFVIGRDDRVVCADTMKALDEEPDYAAIFAAARQAL